MDATFLQDRIDATQTLIIAYEAAITALTTGGVSQYTIDTGQTRQVVTKLNLATLKNSMNGAYNLLATLEARRDGNGSFQSIPGW